MKRLLLAALVVGPMFAQPPTVTVNDYLKEVRVFPGTSPEFSKIASSLGVDRTLPTLGAGAPLVVAIRNDSGENIDSMRIVFEPGPDITLWTGPLVAGQATLAAPGKLRGAVTALLHSGPGISAGPPPAGSLDVYQGVTVTASIDSATFSSGRFIGADTQNLFPRLVEEQAAKRSFFADLATQSKTLTASEMETVLVARQSAADAARRKTKSIADFSLAAITESHLVMHALMALRFSGLPDLGSWIDQENVKLSSEPTLHR